MKRVLCVLTALVAALSAAAATHSAWSERIPWDVLTAVGRHDAPRHVTRAAGIGVACSPGRDVRFVVQAAGAGRLTLSLFDCRGAVVISFGRAGAGTVEWDRRDEAGRAVSPGVYMVRAIGPSVSLTTSFTLPR